MIGHVCDTQPDAFRASKDRNSPKCFQGLVKGNTLVEIIPGVHQIKGVNANSYLIIENDGSLSLIDSGMSTGGKKILEYVKTNLSKQPSELKTILLTHAHVDHIRGASALKKLLERKW